MRLPLWRGRVPARGFTLIELMLVILIVAILAAVLVPMLRGRSDHAKWSEGMAGAGMIADAVRAYAVGEGDESGFTNAAPTLSEIGLLTGDLEGKYFRAGNYRVTGLTYIPATGEIHYTVSVTPPAGLTGGPLDLNERGTWDWNGNPP